MRDEVDLDEARRRIITVAEGANRHRTPHRRAETRPSPPVAASHQAHLRQQSIDVRRADLHQEATRARCGYRHGGYGKWSRCRADCENFLARPAAMLFTAVIPSNIGPSRRFRRAAFVEPFAHLS